MMKHYILAGTVLAIVMAVAGGFLSLFYGAQPEYLQTVPTVPTEVPTRMSLSQAVFSPPDPEQAPPPLRDLVVEGYYILLDTPMHAQPYAGQSRLSCRNCHFEAGRSRNTVSLVGAAAQYPRAVPNPEGNRVVSLPEQVEHCFVDNMGGQALPANSRPMQAILAYLQWISRDLAVYGQVNWLGLQPMQEAGQPDPAAGRQVFAGICSRCHGPEGQGGGIAPPLWGSGSFTTGSDFTDQPTLASFVHKFMPYRKPTLSPQQAGDAAAFVLTRPRQEPGAKAPPMAAPSAAGEPGQVQPLPIPPAMPYGIPPAVRPGPQQLEQVAQQMIRMGVASMPTAQPGPKPKPQEQGPDEQKPAEEKQPGQESPSE